MDRTNTTARRDEKHLSLGIWCVLYERFYGKFWLSFFCDINQMRIFKCCIALSQAGCFILLMSRISTAVATGDDKYMCPLLWQFVLVLACYAMVWHDRPSCFCHHSGRGEVALWCLLYGGHEITAPLDWNISPICLRMLAIHCMYWEDKI